MEKKTMNECILQQDDSSPDSLPVFNADLEHITSYNIDQFKNNGEYTTDTWTLDNWVLEYNVDGKHYQLRRLRMPLRRRDSYGVVCRAFADGSAVHAYKIDEHNLVYMESYVKSIHPTHFFDTEDESFSYDIGWFASREAAFTAFEAKIKKAMHREKKIATGIEIEFCVGSDAWLRAKAEEMLKNRTSVHENIDNRTDYRDFHAKQLDEYYHLGAMHALKELLEHG